MIAVAEADNKKTTLIVGFIIVLLQKYNFLLDLYNYLGLQWVYKWFTMSVQIAYKNAVPSKINFLEKHSLRKSVFHCYHI